jgi:hypothetical protein
MGGWMADRFGAHHVFKAAIASAQARIKARKLSNSVARVARSAEPGPITGVTRLLASEIVA